MVFIEGEKAPSQAINTQLSTGSRSIDPDEKLEAVGFIQIVGDQKIDETANNLEQFQKMLENQKKWGFTAATRIFHLLFPV